MGCAIDGGGEDIGLQHHADAAPGGMVIHGAVAVGGKAADVMGLEAP